MFKKIINYYSLIIAGLLLVVGAYAQTDYEDVLGSANIGVTTDGGFVCPSIPSEPFSSTSTFRINAYHDDMGDPGSNTFEWIVAGGTIIQANGADIGAATSHTATGVENPGAIDPTTYTASILVEFDENLPDMPWVAVRQTSEYGCSDGLWSVIYMQGDNTPPSVVGLPADVPHLAWELRENYPFTVPNVTDDCADFLMFTMSVNGGDPVVLYGDDGEGLIDLQGSEMLIDLIGEAPGDVNNDGTGVNNQVVFTWTDGVSSGSHTWTIHVDYQPLVILIDDIHPSCPDAEDGRIELSWDIELENVRKLEYSFDNVTFSELPGTTLLDQPEGVYYFRVSTLVDGYRSFSEVRTVPLTDPPGIVLSDPLAEGVIIPETCVNQGNGEIHINIEYPNPEGEDPFRPYTIFWTLNGSVFTEYGTNETNLTGLNAGTYTVRVVDTEGCTVDETYVLGIDNGIDPTITDPAGITVPDPASLVDGVVSLNADLDNCSKVITDAEHIIPTANDGTCSDESITLRHDYTGFSWADNTTLVGATFPVGTTNVTWTATDPTGNVATRIYAITVVDNEDPTIIVASDVTLPFCENTFVLPFPTVDDNCGIASVICDQTGETNWWPNISAGESFTTTPITFDNTIATTVTWTVTDIHGNETPGSYEISFTTPLATTAAYLKQNISCNGEEDGSINIAFTGGTAPYRVKVGAMPEVELPIPDPLDPDYPVLLVENLSPGDYVITITDADDCVLQWTEPIVNIDPISIASSITPNACFEDLAGEISLSVTGGNGGFGYAWSGPTYDHYTGGMPWQTPPDINAYLATAENNLTGLPTGRYSLTVADLRGCNQSATFDVEAEDNSISTFTLENSYTVDATSTCDYVPGIEFDPSGVSDADACEVLVWHNYTGAHIGTPSSNTLDGFVLPSGTHNITWYIYDRNGNGTTQVVNYNIVDNEPPSFDTAPANETVNMSVIGSGCGAIIYPNGLADVVYNVSDNCALPPNALTYKRSDNDALTLSDPFPVTGPDNPITITWTLTDAAGLQATHVQEIRVIDDIPPVIDCSTPLTLYIGATGTYTLKLSDYQSSITDNCNAFSDRYAFRTDDPTSNIFNCADIGQTVSIEITAFDIWGNNNTCTREVIVSDNRPPVINANSIILELDANGSVTLNPEDLDAGSTDNCGGPFTYGIMIDEVLEPNMTFDCDDVGSHTITYAVTDKYGNTATAPVEIIVADLRAPDVVLNTITPTFNLDHTGYVRFNIPINKNRLYESISDNCGGTIPVITVTPTTVNCDHIGETSVDLYVEDQEGNGQTYTIPIIVQDVTNPNVSLKEVTLYLDSDDETVIDPEIFNLNSRDNCGNLTFSIDEDTYTCADLGVHEIDVTVSDGNGNDVTQTTTLTILSPVVVTEVLLNACNLTPYFTAEISPSPFDSDDYDWEWRAETSNNGQPNNNVFCTDVDDIGKHKNDQTTCGNTSTEYEPWFNAAHNVDLWIYLRVKPKDSECWSDEFVYFLDISAQGGGTSNAIITDIDACVGDIVNDITVIDLNGSTNAVWSVVGTNNILEISSSSITPNASAPESATANVQFNNTTTGYSTEDYLQLTVSYPAGNKTCLDIYQWHPWVHPLAQPQFDLVNFPYETTVCPGDIVQYQLTGVVTDYEFYEWSPLTNATIINGGGNDQNFIVVEWGNTLGASDVIEVTVRNTNLCVGSIATDPITIEDEDAPEWVIPGEYLSKEDYENSFTITTLPNRSGACARRLTNLPIPEAIDICGEEDNSGNVTRTYTIVENTTALSYSGTSDDYNILDLPVGEYTVTWEAIDLGGNSTDDIGAVGNFVYYITIDDNEDPRFTTIITQREADSEEGSCEYTHNDVSWDMIATDNCGIDDVWVVVYGETLTTLNGVTFTGGSTPVTWHARDIHNREISHSFNVILNDINEPVFAFGPMPSDNPDPDGDPGTEDAVNYEGTLAENANLFIFDQSENQTIELSIPTIITDFCSMGPVSVTLTNPDGSESGPFAISPTGDDYVFTGNVNLGRTLVTWNYADAGGNELVMEHYVVYVSRFGFECEPSIEPGIDFDDHVCNPIEADFNVGTSDATLPAWFEPLFSGNVLNYTVQRNSMLQSEPAGAECETFRDKTLYMDYHISIYGSAVSQLPVYVECTQTFEYFVDTEGPQIDDTDKYNLELECGDDYNATISDWLDNYAGVDILTAVTDNCSANGDISSGPDYDGLVGSTCGPGSVTTVTFTFQDECGQISTFTADIIVDDTTAPEFADSEGNPIAPDDLPEDLTISCDDPIPAAETLYAIDDCDAAPTVTFARSDNRTSNGSCTDNAYTITRTWTASDACGNPREHIQTITIVDDEPAYFTLGGVLAAMPADVSAYCALPTLQTYAGADNCDNNPTYSYSFVSTQNPDPTTSEYYNYTYTRNWSVQDNCQAVPTTHEQVITVYDDVAPEITNPAVNLTVECDGTGNTVAFNNWLTTKGGALATDACALPTSLTWTNNYDENNWVDATDCSTDGYVRYVEVTFTVEDPSGYSSSTTAIFTIEDTSAPVISANLPAMGPYANDGLLPPAYTTVTDLLTAHPSISIADLCSGSTGISIELVSQESNIAASACSYPITRTYRLSDACGNQSAEFTQLFNVFDGVKPVIEKNLTSREGCALDPSSQTTTIDALSLVADDISDNCNEGQWFIDNAASGAIQYLINHLTNNDYDIGWTAGNPDELVFHEGTTEVYYRLTDANGNRSDAKLLYNITVLHMPVLSVISTTSGTGFVGGGDYPLQYSTHSYIVTMENINNFINSVGDTGWEIYLASDTEFASPYNAGTDYTITTTYDVSTETVNAQIMFNGTLPVDGDYILRFTERDAGGCVATMQFPFTLEGPFDVDIDDMLDVCPDSDGAILVYETDVQADGTGTSTTIVYTVNLVSTHYESDWSFDYDISIEEDGAGTNNASVASVSFTSNGSGMTAPTTETGTISVTYNAGTPTTIITLTIAYNDIHGTTQLVTVALTNITGQFGEVDENTQLGDEDDTTIGLDGESDQNNVLHLINNLPLPGNIGGVE